MLRLPILSLLLAPASGDARKPDVVELVGGARLEGRVVYEDEASVILLTGTREREIARREVSRVRSRARSLREALGRWDAIDPPEPRALLDLSATCRQADLQGEADLFAWKALFLDPRNEAAHLDLGHKPQGGGWLVREGTRSIAFDKLDAAHADWGDAWELATTHYRLRTNLPLRLAVDAALELEGFTRAFFDSFGRDLRLRDVLEPMGAHLHADRRSYPESTGGRAAWFDTASNTLVVGAFAGLDRGALFHEATHQLLHATAERTRSGRGSIPGWLDEGLAEHLRTIAGGDPGHVALDPDAVAPAHCRAHATAKEPYGLSRVLALGSEDFAASTKADLKYAQAYTLVHFGLHGEGGKHRRGFLDFLRGAYLGRSSMTDFKSALGLRDERGFEAAWLAHARERAH